MLHMRPLIGLVALGVVSGCGGSDSTAPQAVQAATVTASGTSFAPSSVRIYAGGTVTWKFVSNDPHNVTFGSAAPPDGNVGDQADGASVTRTFTLEGTYSYMCTHHSGMTGTVVVVTKPTSSGGGY